MQLLRLIWVEVARRRGAILGWGIGLALYCIMIISIAPQLTEQFESFDLSEIAIYQAFGITQPLTSISGLLAAYIPFIGVLVAVYGVLAGTNALAGEEDSGTLEIVLALPLPRWLLVVGKAAALTIVLMLISLIVYLGFAVAYSGISDQLAGLALRDLYLVSLELVPLSFMFAMLGLFLGAYLPGRSPALGVGLAVVIGSYLFNNLAGNVASLEGLLPWQPFYYYRGGDVLLEGLDWRRVVTLEVTGLLFLLLAIFSFNRRDVTTGLWPWQRPELAPDSSLPQT